MPAELHTQSKRETVSSDTGLEELDLELSIRKLASPVVSVGNQQYQSQHLSEWADCRRCDLSATAKGTSAGSRRFTGALRWCLA